MKVLTLVGTRPEIIRLSEVIKELDRIMDHVLVHTGQNYDYELNEVFFKDLKLRAPDHFLEAVGETPATTVGAVIAKVDTLLETVKPEALLILGDTNSCLGAYAAKRRKIPIFHMEAGNRSFDARVPEELNRKIIDHMSDINLVYSDITRGNLLNEGLPADRILKTGSPLYEVLLAHKDAIDASSALSEMKLEKGGYFLVSAHREENIAIEENFKRLITILERVAETYKKPIIFSVHPRTRKRLEQGGVTLPKNVILMKPFGFLDYITLQMNALCVLSDSGTISEESSMLNFPAVNLREAHERIEAMDEASVIMSGLNPDRVVQAIELALTQSRGETRDFRIPTDYAYTNVSKKVGRIILSYTDYVHRHVWLRST